MRDLNEISVFARVAQQGSFSAAARSLGMPLSTVSRKVADLEEQLGVSLLQRTTRRLQLTRAGELYYRQCADLLQGFEDAESKITELHHQAEGKLRISVPLGMANADFSDFLSRFLEKYPKIELDLLITNRYVDLVAENVDLALRMGPLEDSSLIARRLGTTHHFLVASAAFVKKFGQPKEPEEIPQFRCLTYLGEGDHDTWCFSKGKAQKKIKVSGRIKASDMMALKELALRGHGIAHLPELYCTAEIREGAFRQLLPEWRSQAFPVHALYSNRRFPPARLLSFLEEIENWKEAHWERLKRN